MAANGQALLQRREDDEGVGSVPFGSRVRLALRPQVVTMLDERRAEPQWSSTRDLVAAIGRRWITR